MKVIRNGKEYHVTVFITRDTKVFKALIYSDDDSECYEVTVGGEMWKLGKGKEFKDEIQQCCQKLIDKLNGDINLSFNVIDTPDLIARPGDKECGACGCMVDYLYGGRCEDCLPF